MARPPSRAGEETEAQGVLQAQHIQILKRDALLSLRSWVKTPKTTALAAAEQITDHPTKRKET